MEWLFGVPTKIKLEVGTGKGLLVYKLSHGRRLVQPESTYIRKVQEKAFCVPTEGRDVVGTEKCHQALLH